MTLSPTLRGTFILDMCLDTVSRHPVLPYARGKFRQYISMTTDYAYACSLNNLLSGTFSSVFEQTMQCRRNQERRSRNIIYSCKDLFGTPKVLGQMVQSRTVKKLAANSDLQLSQNHRPPPGLNARSGHMLILHQALVFMGSVPWYKVTIW